MVVVGRRSKRLQAINKDEIDILKGFFNTVEVEQDIVKKNATGAESELQLRLRLLLQLLFSRTVEKKEVKDIYEQSQDELSNLSLEDTYSSVHSAVPPAPRPNNQDLILTKSSIEFLQWFSIKVESLKTSSQMTHQNMTKFAVRTSGVSHKLLAGDLLLLLELGLRAIIIAAYDKNILQQERNIIAYLSVVFHWLLCDPDKERIIETSIKANFKEYLSLCFSVLNNENLKFGLNFELKLFIYDILQEGHLKCFNDTNLNRFHDLRAILSLLEPQNESKENLSDIDLKMLGLVTPIDLKKEQNQFDSPQSNINTLSSQDEIMLTPALRGTEQKRNYLAPKIATAEKDILYVAVVAAGLEKFDFNCVSMKCCPSKKLAPNHQVTQEIKLLLNCCNEAFEGKTVRSHRITIGTPGFADVNLINGLKTSLLRLGVSRRHACLTFGENGELWITDTNSTNGVCINDVKIPPNEKQKLKHNDEIVFSGGHKVAIGRKRKQLTYLRYRVSFETIEMN